MIQTFIQTPLKKYTFQAPKIKEWVESRSSGLVLNLFAGPTLLNLSEIRNDIDKDMPAHYHLDALEMVLNFKDNKVFFDTIILDPPYSYRKSIEFYNGNYSSKFRLIADNLDSILNKDGRIISFGYHTTFMGKKRGFELEELCVFGHSGAQHATIAIVEKRI